MATTLAKIESTKTVAFRYNDHDVMFNDNKLVCLNDMWRAAGCPVGKEPQPWLQQDQTQGFVAHILTTHKKRNMGVTHVLKSMRGRGGGTFAHWQIGLAYAKYLSHEFHAHANNAFKEWAEEKADPSLKMDRAIAAYAKQGKAATWIDKRQLGKEERKRFASTVFDHNGDAWTVAEGTRSISLKVIGQTPREIKLARAGSEKAKTRDQLSEIELTRIRFAEFEASNLIQARAADGHSECVAACRDAGAAVANLVSGLYGNGTATPTKLPAP